MKFIFTSVLLITTFAGPAFASNDSYFAALNKALAGQGPKKVGLRCGDGGWGPQLEIVLSAKINCAAGADCFSYNQSSNGPVVIATTEALKAVQPGERIRALYQFDGWDNCFQRPSDKCIDSSFVNPSIKNDEFSFQVKLFRAGWPRAGQVAIELTADPRRLPVFQRTRATLDRITYFLDDVKASPFKPSTGTVAITSTHPAPLELVFPTPNDTDHNTCFFSVGDF
jgi:hypothetical protein